MKAAPLDGVSWLVVSATLAVRGSGLATEHFPGPVGGFRCGEPLVQGYRNRYIVRSDRPQYDG